jgi:ubiquitin carboxyl-terminal hydrolase 10
LPHLHYHRQVQIQPTTPNSASAPTMPPLAGVSTASAPRPAFNYAAAAAVGAALSPQDELVKLLSEGVNGKGKELVNTLPRGLINTGNMCFANTVRLPSLT